MNLKITYHHWHDGNDPDRIVRTARTRKLKSGKVVQDVPPSYATEAKLVDLDTGNTLTNSLTFCSPKDNPCRAIGRAIARGRLLKALPEEYPDIDIATIDLGEKKSA